MQIVDLRSDTVTQPTPAMRAAMMQAELGDDVFGDDPSVNALQAAVADRLGFEAALFLPTGTQSNLCGLMAHCQRGDEYIVGQMAHTYRYEGGGAAVLGSIQPQPLNNQADGSILLADIAAAIKPADAHYAISKLLCLENTMGGKVLPSDYIAEASALAQKHGLLRHLDGARLFNAAVATAAVATAAVADVGTGGDPYQAARAITRHFDSVSVCFSKGLGAPVGSVLCGSAEFIQRAHRIRKMLGGGMRQAGLLAAAAHYALDHHVSRLAQDHALAAQLAAGLAGLPGLTIEPVQTNILFIDVAPERSAGLLAHLKAHGILATGLYRLRMVTHMDVDQAGIERTIAAMRAYFLA